MSRVREELRVVPRTAWVVAALVCICLAVLFPVAIYKSPDFQQWPGWSMGPFALLITLVCTAFVVVVGYVNGDARRRGMRHVMWTLLAIFVPNAIGIILYFIFREPLLVPCPKCGAQARANFAFCPTCGDARGPACPQCRRAVEAGWSHCAFCGARMG